MVILAMADEPQGTLFGDAPDFEGATLPAKVPAFGYLAVLARRAIVDWCRRFLAFCGDAPTARLGVEEGSTF